MNKILKWWSCRTQELKWRSHIFFNKLRLQLHFNRCTIRILEHLLRCETTNKMPKNILSISTIEGWSHLLFLLIGLNRTKKHFQWATFEFVFSLLFHPSFIHIIFKLKFRIIRKSNTKYHIISFHCGSVHCAIIIHCYLAKVRFMCGESPTINNLNDFLVDMLLFILTTYFISENVFCSLRARLIKWNFIHLHLSRARICSLFLFLFNRTPCHFISFFWRLCSAV